MTVLRNAADRLWVALALSAVLAAGIGTWALLARPGSLQPRARQYLNVTACLLTPQTGIAHGTPAASGWASMEAASLRTHVMVSYLADTGPDDVPMMLNTLVARRCRVIVTAGADLEPVIAAAKANPHQQFIVVTAEAGPLPIPPNVTTASPPNAPEQIDHALLSAAAA